MSIDPVVYMRVQLSCLIIGAICTALAIAAWAVVFLKARKRLPFRYCLFVVALAACFAEQLHYVILMGTDTYMMDAKSADCILQETWLMTTELVSTSAPLAYMVLCVLMAYRNVVTTLDTVLAMAGVTLGSAVISGAWSLAKYHLGRPYACLDWSLTDNYEWIINTPRLIVPVVLLCVSSLLLFQLLRLNTALIKETRLFKIIRHSCVLLAVLSAYLMFYEIYYVATTHLSEHVPIEAHFVTGFLFCTKGIVLSFFYCFLDLEVLSYCPCACVRLEDGTVEESGEEQPLSGWRSSKEVVNQQDQPRSEVTHVSSFEHEVKPVTNVQARLMYGSLGSDK